MKKLLIGLFAFCCLLLLGVYQIGEKAQRETQKIFSQINQQGVSATLLSYNKTFFKATALSEITVSTDEGKTITFNISSTIHHYPYKAVIKNKVRLQDELLNKKVEDYFGRENWLTSMDQISLLGDASGVLKLLPGHYDAPGEQFSTKGLVMNYQFNLQDRSGTMQLDWGGASMQQDNLSGSLDSVQISSTFAALTATHQYDYVIKIANVLFQQGEDNGSLLDIKLAGASYPGEQPDTVDGTHNWSVASYLYNDGQKKEFTENHLKFELKGLSAPALMKLQNASNDPDLALNNLTELLAYGGQFSLTELTSQTPWGKVDAAIDLTVEQGVELPAIINNPFVLLDYISGRIDLSLPEAMLELPEYADFLQAGLNSGILIRKDQKLITDTQFEQGELTINGQVIPL